MKRLLCLMTIVCGICGWSADFFTDDGLFAPVQADAKVDLASSRALPGDVAALPGVLRLQKRGHHRAWVATSKDPATFHFVLSFREPQAVGSCMFVGDYELSYLKGGAPNDPNDESHWIAVAYPGEAKRLVRVVPLPVGITTQALRLSAPGQATPAGEYRRELALFTAWRDRLVNIAPEAAIRVSSSYKPAGGFRPDPRRSSPESLLDGSLAARNWESATRDVPISPEAPEWLMLDWGQPRSMRGLNLLIGSSQSGAGQILIQAFRGDGDPDPGVDAGWELLTEMKPQRTWRPPTCWEVTTDFGRDVSTRALRLLVLSGTPEAQSGGEQSNLTSIGFGEIIVVEALGDGPARRIVRQAGGPEGVVPIRFTMPAAGKASIRIVDPQGAIVCNLVNGESFDAGEQTVWWDLATIDDYWPPYERPEKRGYVVPDGTALIALPGGYRWEGIWHPGLGLEYLYSYYPEKKHGLAWTTADTTGGWLADHQPPQTIVRVGDRMWAGTFCEGGHAILEADLDMRKLWGSGRIWLACPRVMAVSDDRIYYLEQGGWAKKVVMIEVDPATKRSRRLLGREIAKDEVLDIQGLAVVGTRAFIADRANDRLIIVDMTDNLGAAAGEFSWDIAYKLREHEQMKEMGSIELRKPGRIRPYGQGHLAVVSDTTVQLLDLESLTLKPLVTGLTNPLGLAVDELRNVYVGEMEPVHQVKVFNVDGNLVRSVGKVGPHRLGTFDRDNLESPAGVEVDAAGNIWVCELNHSLKRTSLWDKQGRCINQVLGPTIYGGGGDIDPRNENRFWYQGKEFERDPVTGAIAMTRLVWRADDDSFDHFFGGASHNFGGRAPAYPFYHNGRLFFTSWQGWAAGRTTTLWRHDPDGMRPVAAVGTPPAWFGERFPELAAGAVFAWTDRNGDGIAQREEVEAGPITLNDKPWKQVGAQWQFLMNEHFVVAVTDASYNEAAVAWFHPASFTAEGYPVYELPTKLLPVPIEGLRHSADAIFTDRDGNAITLDEYIVSMRPDGTVKWRYKNRWPGLHAGHGTSATGEEPGVIIAPTRFFGSAYVNETIGEVISLSSNLGATYLLTADGFYIDRVFQDIRTGLSWRMNSPPTPEIMDQLSLNDEHFGGTFQGVLGDDGRTHYRYVVGKTHSSVVELHGLEKIGRLSGGDLTVTGEHLLAAEELRRGRALDAKVSKVYTIKWMETIEIDGRDNEWPGERIDGFALAYDRENLYLWFSGEDSRAPFANATTDDMLEAFKNGDVVDVMLETKGGLDPQRSSAGEGDIRLSFAMVDGKPAAILYDYVVPGTPAEARLPFSSPWRTIYIDRVTLLEQARIAVVRQAKSFSLEAAVPLSALHLDPTRAGELRGDVGRVHSDQTGTRAVAREYWSNKATAIMSDVPSEAMLQPSLWGSFRFEVAP